MDGSFRLDEHRNFIIEFKNDDVKIFAADINNYPTTIELFLTSFDDIQNQKFLNMDKAFIEIINNINKQYPILKICYEEKLIITKNHKLYIIAKNNNQYNLSEIIIEEYNKENTENMYEIILDKLKNGQQVHIGSFLIDLNVIKRCIKDSYVLNSIQDEKTRIIISSIMDIYISEINSKLSSYANDDDNSSEVIKSRLQISEEQYKNLYNRLLNGEIIDVGNIRISYISLQEFAQNESIIDDIADIRIEEVLKHLVKIYINDKNKLEENAGESGNETAKVKVRKAGFVNKIFMISLSGFTFGIIVTLIFILITRYIF